MKKIFDNNSVNIITGVTGSGKTTSLLYLTRQYLNDKKNVLFITDVNSKQMFLYEFKKDVKEDDGCLCIWTRKENFFAEFKIMINELILKSKALQKNIFPDIIVIDDLLNTNVTLDKLQNIAHYHNCIIVASVSTWTENLRYARYNYNVFDVFAADSVMQVKKVNLRAKQKFTLQSIKTKQKPDRIMFFGDWKGGYKSGIFSSIKDFFINLLNGTLR